jgi:hypothetical protein
MQTSRIVNLKGVVFPRALTRGKQPKYYWWPVCALFHWLCCEL